MKLSETGESRVNGYVFVLERSLKSFLPSDVVRDATREIESHVRERVAAHDGSPNERAALEQILNELGPPLRVAQAYSAERIIDEAVTTGRVVPICEIRVTDPANDQPLPLRSSCAATGVATAEPRRAQVAAASAALKFSLSFMM